MIKKILNATLITASIISPICLADSDHSHHSLTTHRHGEAMMNIVFEGKKLEIELESPARNLLGFEHAPKTDSEKSHVKNVAQKMKNLESMFDIPKAAGCQLKKARIDSELLENEEHEAGSHADFEAEYELVCEKPEHLNALKVNIFKEFPQFERINVEWINNDKQGAETLTGLNSKVQM